MASHASTVRHRPRSAGARQAARAMTGQPARAAAVVVVDRPPHPAGYTHWSPTRSSDTPWRTPGTESASQLELGSTLLGVVRLRVTRRWTEVHETGLKDDAARRVDTTAVEASVFASRTDVAVSACSSRYLEGHQNLPRGNTRICADLGLSPEGGWRNGCR